MVLKDDSFKTIVTAVSQGRAIFDNIRKFIIFLLSGNAGEIMIVAFPMLIDASMPLLPLQILYLNMIGDVFPALALGVGKDDSSNMQHPPRDRKEAILTGRHWMRIVLYGFLISLPVLAAFYLALDKMDMKMDRAVTVSFLTLAFSRLWHVFNMRHYDSGIFKNEVTVNPFIWGALAICILLLLGGVYLPGLSKVLRLIEPGFYGWLLILSLSFVPLLFGQIWKIIKRRYGSK